MKKNLKFYKMLKPHVFGSGGVRVLLKVTFDIPYGEVVAGNTSHGLCIPVPGGNMPKLGETWVVDVVNKVSRRSFHVKLVRKLKSFPSDYKYLQKGQPDFEKGVLSFKKGISYPLSMTAYARAWEDYQILSNNTNAVIIREGCAIRWRKKGKPPEELPLHRFATKYKRQPLLGEPEDIENFLNNLDLYVAKAIMESKRKRTGMFFENGAQVKERAASATSL